jgi:hypothetical protein
MKRANCILKALKDRFRPVSGQPQLTESRFPNPASPVHLELLIPDLIAPDAAVAQGLALPALERLLGRGRRTVDAPISTEDWLAAAAGLRADDDEQAPAYAALSLLGDGGVPGDTAWLRADPVHMRVDRDQMLADPLPAATLDDEDAAALVATLTVHFAADGIRFSATSPRTWYAETARPPDAAFTPLADAAGNNADALRPRGRDAMAWQRIANEVQMLLHEHPVNLVRETRGELPINSVWFWGAGVMPAKIELRFKKVWGDEPIARGIAALAGLEAAKAPISAAQWLQNETGGADSGRYLMVLDDLRKAIREQGVDAWRAGLQAYERDWFAPLLEALRRDRIGMLTIHALAPHCTLSVEIIRGDLLRIWRRAKPLAAYAGLQP